MVAQGLAVAIFVAIVMPIQIRLQFAKIAYYMIRTLAYLLENFQKQQLLKKVRKKAGL